MEDQRCIKISKIIGIILMFFGCIIMVTTSGQNEDWQIAGSVLAIVGVVGLVCVSLINYDKSDGYQRVTSPGYDQSEHDRLFAVI